jgi:hypothetical protein
MGNSAVLKAFENIKSEELFANLKLPIKSETNVSESSFINKAFEIDISSKKKIKALLKVNKLDCMPLLFVISTP